VLPKVDVSYKACDFTNMRTNKQVTYIQIPAVEHEWNNFYPCTLIISLQKQ
jgi:hypothetical protein